MVYIQQLSRPKDIKKSMREIGVDPYGINIMFPKACAYLIRIKSLSNIAANILKQEMLSLGADAAIARGALTGQKKKTDCLLMANLAQLRRLSQKLNKQPFGLCKVSLEISEAIDNYRKDKFNLEIGKHRLCLGAKPVLMGIVNLTPDSFSGDGFYSSDRVCFGSGLARVYDYAQKMVSQGAGIIDLGAESSRPQARIVSLKEELSRAIPAIKILAKKLRVPVSVDTRKPEVARQALECGASIINDIGGLRDLKMAKVIAKYKAAVVIMHMKGVPATMQKNTRYDFLISEIIEFLRNSIARALEAGISPGKIIIDPGIGFGKDLSGNLEILKSLREFKILGKPILIGPSRKSFIGQILGKPVEERLYGTLASCIIAAGEGANILRIHDIKQIKEALKVWEAVRE
jgi:dihydropteroate synthase